MGTGTKHPLHERANPTAKNQHAIFFMFSAFRLVASRKRSGRAEDGEEQDALKSDLPAPRRHASERRFAVDSSDQGTF